MLYISTKSSCADLLSTELDTAFASFWNLLVSIRRLRFQDFTKCFCHGRFMFSEKCVPVCVCGACTCACVRGYKIMSVLNDIIMHM